MDIFNSLGKVLENALRWVINLLPDSPFKAIDNSPVAQYLGYINWFVPISAILSILEVWLVAVGIYYAYQVILRWVKAIN